MDRELQLRIIEAALFTAKEPLSVASLRRLLPESADIEAHLQHLQKFYCGRGVCLRRLGGGWMFTTAEDLAGYLVYNAESVKTLSRAALEVLAIIAYHQPVTRVEIEALRGVSLSRGTLDMLLRLGWIVPRRRRGLGRATQWRVSDLFLRHFGLDSAADLPGMAELRAAGFMSGGRELGLLSMEASESGEF